MPMISIFRVDRVSGARPTHIIFHSASFNFIFLSSSLYMSMAHVSNESSGTGNNNLIIIHSFVLLLSLFSFGQASATGSLGYPEVH